MDNLADTEGAEGAQLTCGDHGGLRAVDGVWLCNDHSRADRRRLY